MANDRGEVTRARLIEATAQVVREVGYAHASTRAIAKAAGVAEGTIYRHFPDKGALFLAAVMESNRPIIEWVAGLPARAGLDTVEANLADCLVRLAGLRDQMLPLELALLTDPELAGQNRRMDSVRPGALPAGPPEYVADYLAAEQRLGRVRTDVAPDQMAIVILATLFGLSILLHSAGTTMTRDLLATAIGILLAGIEPSPPRA